MNARSKDDSLPRPKRRLRLLVLLLSLVGGLLLVEGVARYLLFGSSDFAAKHGREYRRPGLYADSQLEDAYWLLMQKLHGETSVHPSPHYDELLGWTNHNIEPATYRHLGEDPLDERRPVLMYGASFAQGLGSGEVDGAPFSEELCFLNYGVGGYGADQAYLLMRETLDHFADRDPIVAIGLVAESDFDRCILRFRSMPKPRLVLQSGELEPEGPVPPGGAAAYLEEHGTGITSYAWRYVLGTKGLLPDAWRHRLAGRTQLVEEQNELVDALVLAIRDELTERGLQYGFVLFCSPSSLPPREASRRERKLVKLFDAHSIPYVHMRFEMIAAAEELGVEPRELFIESGPRKNHPNELGNRVILEVLRERAAAIARASAAGD